MGGEGGSLPQRGLHHVPEGAAAAEHAPARHPHPLLPRRAPQRRITTAVHGAAVTALETVGGRALLRAMMRDYGVDHPLTRLTVPLADGVDPDDTYTVRGAPTC